MYLFESQNLLSQFKDHMAYMIQNKDWQVLDNFYLIFK